MNMGKRLGGQIDKKQHRRGGKLGLRAKRDTAKPLFPPHQGGKTKEKRDFHWVNHVSRGWGKKALDLVQGENEAGLQREFAGCMGATPHAATIWNHADGPT